MSGKNKFQKAISKLWDIKADKVISFSGLLGVEILGNDIVDVPGRQGFVYVRLRDSGNEVIQAYNANVSPVYDLPVLVTRDENNPTFYRIIGRDLSRYARWGASSYLPRHGLQHSFGPSSDGGGGDVTWVYSRQIMPFVVFPSGTYGSDSVTCGAYWYHWSGAWHYAGNTGTSLSAYAPTGSNTARMVLLYLEPESGNLLVATGSLTEFDNSWKAETQVAPYIPSPLEAHDIPLVAVRLISPTGTMVGWDNLYDLREWFGRPSIMHDP